MNSNNPPVYSSSYKNYVLLILTGVYTFNFIDRQILVILQESIKVDLELSDTQLGLLTGFAFAIFYVTLGIPIARLADKYNRKNIISLALIFWSAMTALSGLAQNFIHLLLARIGVGVGEAGGSPPAHSMISDYFPKEKRATALSIYSIGIYIGVLLGYLGGGWLDEYFGWRIAFLVLGVPGIIYAFILYFTVKEPERGYSDRVKTLTQDPPNIFQVFKILMSRRSFIFIALGSGLNTFSLYAVGNWSPSFLFRLHDMSIGEIGTWLALIAGIAGGVGTYLGGYLSDKIGKADRRWYLWLPALAILISIPFQLGYFFLSTTSVVLFMAIFPNLLQTTYLGPSLAMTHGMVSIRMRAFSSAVLFFILNFIGLGLGPLFVGMLSDYLTPSMGIESIRWALSITVIASFLAVLCFFYAGTILENDLDRELH